MSTPASDLYQQNAGVHALNTGPIVIRTYNDLSGNNTFLLGKYDIPISSNYVLITSANGKLVPSNAIYVSSIAASTITSLSGNISTLNANNINVSSLAAISSNINMLNANRIDVSTLKISTMTLQFINYSSIIGSTISTNTLLTSMMMGQSLNFSTGFGSTFTVNNMIINSTLSMSTLNLTRIDINILKASTLTANTQVVNSTLLVSTLTASNIIGSALTANTQVVNSTILVSTLTASNIIGSALTANTQVVNSTLLVSTLTVSNISVLSLSFNSFSTITGSSIIVSTINTSTLTSNNINLSTINSSTINAQNLNFLTSIGSALTIDNVSINSQLNTSTIITNNLNYSNQLVGTTSINNLNYTQFGQNRRNISNITINGCAISANGRYILYSNNTLGISYSSNYGNSFTQSDLVGTSCVAMSASGQHAVAVSSISPFYVYISSNYGKNWIRNDLNFAASIFTSNSAIIVMSASGQYVTMVYTSITTVIYRSSDYGLTFTAATSDNTWTSLAMSASGQYQIASTTVFMYNSNNYGITWSVSSGIPSSYTISACAMSASGRSCYAAVIQIARIYVSFNFGVSWFLLGDPNPNVPSFNAYITTICTSASGQYVMAGSSSQSNMITIYYSKNSTSTWTSGFILSTTLYPAVFNVSCMSASGQYTLIGNSSNIPGTNNGIQVLSQYSLSFLTTNPIKIVNDAIETIPSLSLISPSQVSSQSSFLPISNHGIIIGQAETTYNAFQIFYNHVSFNNTANYISIGSYNSTSALNINALGNVGIGTIANINSQLHVHGDTSTSILISNNYYGGIISMPNLRMGISYVNGMYSVLAKAGDCVIKTSPNSNLIIESGDPTGSAVFGTISRTGILLSSENFVGIGVTSSNLLSFPFQVENSINIQFSGSIIRREQLTWQYVEFNNILVSIVATGYIMSYAGFLIASDIRIKKNIRLNTGSLSIINNIPIYYYEYIDPYIDGFKCTYDVIAQDIFKVLPEMCYVEKKVVPNIFKMANSHTLSDNIVTINIENVLNANDTIELRFEKKEKVNVVIILATSTYFKCSIWDNYSSNDEIFVYGSIVDDFINVDKPRLGILALAGVKELHQIVEEQNTYITLQSNTIEKQGIQLQQQAEQINSLMQRLTAAGIP